MPSRNQQISKNIMIFKKSNKPSKSRKNLSQVINTKNGFIWIDKRSESFISRSEKWSPDAPPQSTLKCSTKKIKNQIVYSHPKGKKIGVNDLNFYNVSHLSPKIIILRKKINFFQSYFPKFSQKSEIFDFSQKMPQINF